MKQKQTSTMLQVQSLLFLAVSSTLTNGKVFQTCELARDLVFNQQVPRSQVADWVCLAEHASSFITGAVGARNADGSRNHGIFQISDRWWCSEPGSRGNNGCGVSCAALRDSNIRDDFACANRIYEETRKISGIGFYAWDDWKKNCRGRNLEKYVKGCFKEDSNPEFRPTKTKPRHTTTSPWWVKPSPKPTVTPPWWLKPTTATPRSTPTSKPSTVTTTFKCGGLSLECIDIPGNTVYPFQCRWIGEGSVPMDGAGKGGVSFVGDGKGTVSEGGIDFADKQRVL